MFLIHGQETLKSFQRFWIPSLPMPMWHLLNVGKDIHYRASANLFQCVAFIVDIGPIMVELGIGRDWIQLKSRIQWSTSNNLFLKSYIVLIYSGALLGCALQINVLNINQTILYNKFYNNHLVQNRLLNVTIAEVFQLSGLILSKLLFLW